MNKPVSHDIIRLKLYKMYRKNGYNKKQALFACGVRTQKGSSLMIKGDQQLAQELQQEKYTKSYFLQQSESIYNTALQLKKPDLTNANRSLEFQADIAGVRLNNITNLNFNKIDINTIKPDEARKVLFNIDAGE